MSIILFAIPLFFLLIFIELWFDKRAGHTTYRFNDAINSLNLGMMSQVTAVAYKTLQFSVYVLLFEHAALFDWSAYRQQPAFWLFAFVAYDFCYYWFHRMSHEINLLWAGHVVHHQSEEYNLTTALRQSSGGFFGFVFYLPLALLGIDPLLLLTVGSLNLVYQFWVHTRHIDRLPAWYEAVFVTPSSHRVHHAQNPLYMNKNHGGVFILWDRWFGTFQPELAAEPVVFGITKPLQSWNPLWANVDTYWSLCKDAWRTGSLADKWRVFFSKTGWRPADMRKQFPNKRYDPYQQVKFDVRLRPAQMHYVFFQHLTLIALVLAFLLTAGQYSNGQIWLLASSLVLLLVCLGMYQQQQRLALWLEPLKNAVLLLIALSAGWSGLLTMPFAVLALAWFSGASWLLWRAQRQPELSPELPEQQSKA